MVVEEGDLLFTSLIAPDPNFSEATLEQQVSDVTEKVLRTLAEVGGESQDLVRLHLYLADTKRIDEVEAALIKALPHGCNPALVIIGAGLPRANAAVAMDAVSAVPSGTRGFQSNGFAQPHAAILPRGPVAFVSGRAAPGDISTATLETLRQLEADLARLGLHWRHTIQMKVFLEPIESMDTVRKIIIDFLPDGATPALVFVEWIQTPHPVEIELIASAASAKTLSASEFVEYHDSNGRFSRIVFADSGELIFTGGIRGDSQASPAIQVEQQFSQLEALLKTVGSDMSHLLKATYYVADPAAERSYNAIRPRVFPSDRAPSASRARVQGAGGTGESSALDMIAIRPR